MVGLKPWACHATGNEANLLAGRGSCLAQKEGARVCSEDKEPKSQSQSQSQVQARSWPGQATGVDFAFMANGEWIKTRSKTHSHNIL